MKQNIHHPVSARQSRDGLYYLFYPLNWIIITLLLFSATGLAQETPSGQDKFYIGTEFQNETIENPSWYDLFYQSGMNLISQRADEQYTKQYLEGYNVLACNVQHKEDWIAYYTTCYYSKWEAEIDAEPDRVGFKHRDNNGNLIGSPAIYPPVTGRQCWSSIGLSEPRDSLMYGPLYRQDKRYKRGLYYNQNLKDSVYYIPRFIMALDNHGNATPDKDVCKIKVVFRYKNEVTGHHDYTFPLERTLKVSDFDASGAFDDFYLHPDPRFATYCYPEQFWLPKNIENFPDAPSSIGYIDDESYTGIQYWVEWLGNDDLYTLYIDYVEVYDRDGWKEYIDDPGYVDTLITNYAEDYPIQDWPNLKYWLGVDEPYSIDCYEPIRVVDEIVRSVSPNTPVIVPFNPSWNWDQSRINGEDEISMFYNIANPSKITLSINPSLDGWPEIHTFEWLRYNFQRTSALDPDFWFNAQTLGYKRSDGTWCVWRKPEPEELRAMVMLALAHGAKGIIFKWFDSYNTTMFNEFCNTSNSLMDCIVTPLAQPTSLYYQIKNYLTPRLTGKLGNTIKDLNYSGNFLQYRYQIPTHDNPAESGTDYLILGYGIYDAHERNWHCGFFDRPGQTDNKYFLLANLYLTAQSKTVRVKVISLNQDYTNWRFRNVEGLFDETFTNYIIKDLNHPKGEGYLYQVAPVIKYGGRLLYSESTQAGMI